MAETSAAPVHPETQPNYYDIASESVVKIIDLLPPPRHMRTYPEEMVDAMTRIADVQRLNEGIDFVHVKPGIKSVHGFMGGLVVDGLRNHGQRVGPFRKRKIHKIAQMEWSA